MPKRHKFNEKKILHKIGKHWCIISIVLLGLISGASFAQQNIHADELGEAVEKNEGMNQYHPYTESRNTVNIVNGATIAVNNDWQTMGRYMDRSDVQANSNAYSTFNQAKGVIEGDREPLTDYGEMVSNNATQEANDLAYNANSVASSATVTADNYMGNTLPPLNDVRSQAFQYNRSMGYYDGMDGDAETSSDPNVNYYTPSENSESGIESNDYITARGIVNSDADTLSSYINRDDFNYDNDVADQVEDDSESIDETRETMESDPTYGSSAVSIANSYLNNASSLMSSSASGFSNTVTDDSMAVAKDEDQMKNDSQELDSLEDSLSSEGIDITDQDTNFYNFSSEVDDANYSMSDLYDNDVVDTDPEDGSTHSDVAYTADYLKDEADSAAYDGNDYMSQVDSYANSVNSVIDSSAASLVSSYADKTIKRAKRARKRKVKHPTHSHRRNHVRHYRKRIDKRRQKKRTTRTRRKIRPLPRRTFSKYWNYRRHVRAKHRIKVYEVNDVTPGYKSKIVKSKWIRVNRKIYIKRRGIEWMWILSGPGLRHHGHYYWIYNGDAKHVNHFKRL